MTMFTLLTIFFIVFPLFVYAIPRHLPEGVELLGPEKLKNPAHLFTGHLPKTLDPSSVPKKSFDVFTVKPQETPKSDHLEDFNFVEEIHRPVSAPKHSKSCGIVRLLVNRPFGKIPKPAIVPFAPPKDCTTGWKKVKLTVSGKGLGHEESRFLSVYFDDLLLLRLTTPNGSNKTIWAYEKDVTNYAAYLASSRKVTVTLPRRVESPGSYNITLALTFYKGKLHKRFADVIIPVGTRYFSLSNESNSVTETIKNFPRNAYRAQLEILSTPRGPDQLLAFSIPTEFATEIPYVRSNGVFREIQASVDGLLAGAVWPKTVLQPFFLFEEYWHRIVGIGVYNAPSFFIDITPFIGKLVVGGSHDFSFKIPEISAGSRWITSATLHVWLDKGSKQTSGELKSRKVVQNVKPRNQLVISKDNQAVDVRVAATRLTVISGNVYTSFGNFSSYVIRQQRFVNAFRARRKSDTFSLDQETSSYYSSVLSKLGDRKKVFYSYQENYRFPLQVMSEGFATMNGFFSQTFNFHKNLYLNGTKQRLVEHLSNNQIGVGYQLALSNSAGATVSQNYSMRTNYDGCYGRKFVTGVDGVIRDEENFKCK